MVTLADVSYRDRKILKDLAEHVHFLDVVSPPGGRLRVVARRRREYHGYSLGRLEPLHSLGLIKSGSLDGDHCIVLTPAGKALVLELAGTTRRSGIRTRMDPANFWWLKQ